MLRFIIAAVLCALFINVEAQHTLSGVVKGTSGPLKDAAVTVVEINRTEPSDADGKFSIAGVPPGRYSVMVSFLGYSDYTVEVDLTEDVSLAIQLSETVLIADEVMVTALRAGKNTPATFTNVDKKTIAKQNFGQDLPYILNWTPSIVTTSDAGAGVGYTGMRIRGSDATHINVTINGIPYNDSESQSVYWVDIPDVASSTESIQIQRGVGTSTNGAAAFGASVNLQTNALQKDPYAELGTSYGSFNTQKYTAKAGTGLINDTWAFDGRYSLIKSDGYIERASSDLNSFYLSAGYHGKSTMVKAILFGGHETTYQSWYGIDADMLKVNRRFNYAGAIYNGLFQVERYYDNQVDDYGQDHYQLHFAHAFPGNWNVTAAAHYTYGRGYFEEYAQSAAYSDLGLDNVIVGSDTVSVSDFITRQWLKNRFYGATYSVTHSGERVDLTIGGAINTYGNAQHFGEIIWAQYAGNTHIRHHYYDGTAQKDDFNMYAKLNVDFTEKLNGFLDLQYRTISYTTAGIDDDQSAYSIDDQFNFFNPKAGLSYTLSSSDILYASYAVANREPTRADYLGGLEKPRSERLGNLEAGWRKSMANLSFELNYYLMNYQDQLVLTGQLNSGGYPIRSNVGKSYRTGVELSGTIRISPKLTWTANATWSKNKNKELVEVDGDNNPVTYSNTDIILSPGWIAGSQFAWSPARGAEFALLSKYVGTQYLDNTGSDAVKLDSYLINDIRLSYAFAPTSLKGVEIGLLINNIFDVEYSSNGAAYGGVPYFYPQAGINYLGRLTVKF